MKRLKVYFFTIFIMMASPALASTSNYDELRNDVTSCVEKKREESTAPEKYITKRTGELKGKKITRPIEHITQINLGTSVYNLKSWRCSIDAQPNAIINETIIKVTPIGGSSLLRPEQEAKEKCIKKILELTAIDDWYVSECLTPKRKKKYDIETVDDYYTKIYQFYNKPESESEPDSGSVSVSGSTDTAQQQTDNGSQTTSTTNNNNNSAFSKISVTVSNYYKNTGIKNITVCNNNDCKKSDKNGKVTFTATTPQNIHIEGASEYYCDKPKDITQLRTDEQDISQVEIRARRENPQHQFIINCGKLCTDKDLQKLNKNLKEQNKIESCYWKSPTEYEITKCKYPESKLDNNQCKLYLNNITINGKEIDINKVEISLSKTTSNFERAEKTTAIGKIITIRDIDLDETKYISAKHGEQMITCEFKFRNNTICDFGSLNDEIIEEDVPSGTSNTSAENNDDQPKIQDEEKTEGKDSSGTPNTSTDNNKSNDTENNDNQNQKPDEEKTKENDSSGIIIDPASANVSNDIVNNNNQQDVSKEKQANEEQITKEQYNEIKSEINKIRTDIKEKIESQCPSRKTDQKCKNKNKIIKQIDEAAKKTLKELNGAWK